MPTGRDAQGTGLPGRHAMAAAARFPDAAGRADRSRDRPLPAARALTGNDILGVAWLELAILGGLVLTYAVAGAMLDEGDYDVVNTIGALVLAVTLFGGAWRMALISSLALWMGALWFRISLAVYFGIGSVIHHLFNTETARQAEAFFFAQPIHLLKVNAASALGAFCTVATFQAAAMWTRPKPLRLDPAGDDRLLYGCATVFAAIGYSVKYAVTIPASFGAFGDFVVPGMVGALTFLAPVGLFLLTLWGVRHAPRILWLASALLAMDVVTGTILFNKTEVLKAVIVFLLALLQHKLDRKRLLLAAAVVLAIFQTIVPIVEFGRGQLSLRYRSISSSSLSERFDITRSYFTDDRGAKTGEELQGSLARIAYLYPAAPAIATYDSGRAGDSLSDIFIVFIPRMLWPEKPVFNVGAQYNEAINGNAGSASWMGLFVEGYWNLGWLGVGLIGTAYGAMLFVLGKMSLDIICRKRWLHFLIVFLGMFGGIRTDGSFVLEIVVSFVVCLVFSVLATFAEGIIKPYLHASGRSRGGIGAGLRPSR